ncbi:MAG: peptidylprolyl isomerase [Bacteroidales bacterium]|jgi:peptidyl-prolyl cis-trans isomerase B (cyclophilin B)|nr:peptidylprolyl isomerase [Bacteroidales bacterium]MBR3572942.1 peptidylprolyl isomerase [Bacteroidales bacterium]
MKKTATFLILLSVIVLSSCSSQKKVESDSKKTNSAAEVKTEAKAENKPEKMTEVLIKTTKGNIKIALYNETPQHRDNFIKLVKENYYDGVLFHRIIQGFMIQTGDPDSKTAKPGQRLGAGGPSYRIPAEFVPTLYHRRGAVAAARDNNPAKASSGSQFYIVDGKPYDNAYLDMLQQRTGKVFNEEQRQIYTTLGGAPFLDGDYTVFGQVLSGMEVVDKIAAQPKDQFDRPMEDIKIISVTILN